MAGEAAAGPMGAVLAVVARAVEAAAVALVLVAAAQLAGPADPAVPEAGAPKRPLAAVDRPEPGFAPISEPATSWWRVR